MKLTEKVYRIGNWCCEMMECWMGGGGMVAISHLFYIILLLIPWCDAKFEYNLWIWMASWGLTDQISFRALNHDHWVRLFNISKLHKSSYSKTIFFYNLNRKPQNQRIKWTPFVSIILSFPVIFISIASFFYIQHFEHEACIWMSEFSISQKSNYFFFAVPNAASMQQHRWWKLIVCKF